MKQEKKYFTDFRKGLWVVGGRENTPQGFLRRADAIHPVKTTSLRSRFGSTLKFANVNANGLIVFGTDNHIASDASGNLYFNSTLKKTGLNGNPLVGVKMAPQVGQAEYLFLSNLGTPLKFDSSGNLTNWGIVAPTTQPTLVLGPSDERQIDSMDATTGWTVSSGTGTLSTDNSFFQEGTGSLKVAGIPKKSHTTIIKDLTFDATVFATASWAATTGYTANATEPWLGSRIKDSNGNVQICTTTGTSGGSAPTWNTVINGTTTDNTVTWTNYGTATSSTADLFEFWLGVDEPNNLEYIIFEVYLHTTAHRNRDYYTYKVDVANLSFTSAATPTSPWQSEQQNSGINSVLNGNPQNGVEKNFVTQGIVPGMGTIYDPQTLRAIRHKMHHHHIKPSPEGWTRVQIAKDEMDRIGTGPYDWSNIVGFRFLFRTNGGGSINVWLDDLALVGGYGLEGDYQYAVTFANTSTTSISNPQPMINNNTAFATIKGVKRQSVLLSGIPTSTDPQVNGRVLYRTLGNGSLLFYLDTIPDNTTTTYTDIVADFAGAAGGNEVKVLGVTQIYPIQLLTDNTPPYADSGMVVGPYQGSVFWVRTSDTSKLYYSPIGRPEAVENFISLNYLDDGILTLFIFNGYLFAVGRKRVYNVVQVNQSPLLYAFQVVMGIPGVVDPFSVVVGKNGVAWHAPEGIILFNGATANRIDIPVEILFRGENGENLSAMTIAASAYVKGEFWFTNSTQTLAYDEDFDSWRSLGIGLGGLAFDEVDQQAVGTLGGNEVYLEVAGTYTDNGTAIPFQFQSPALLFAEDINTTVSRIVFDINTNGQTITPTILVNDADLLPGWVTLTSYAVGVRVLDSNGNVQQVTTAGTSGLVAPTWSSTPQGTTADGTVTWTCQGPGRFTLSPISTPNRRRVEYNPRFAAESLSLRLTGNLTTNLIELFEIEVLATIG